MGIFLLLCLLPALLATDSAKEGVLTCNVCMGDSPACDVAPGTCPDDQVTGGCISRAEDISLGGLVENFYSKECLRSFTSDIKGPFSFTLGNDQYIRINVTQCNTDLCNSDTPQVSPDTAPNGRQCPTCVDMFRATCDSQIMPCTGLENYCLDYTGNTVIAERTFPFAAKGCASMDIAPGTVLRTNSYTLIFNKKMTPPTTIPEITPTPTTLQTTPAPTISALQTTPTLPPPLHKQPPPPHHHSANKRRPHYHHSANNHPDHHHSGNNHLHAH